VKLADTFTAGGEVLISSLRWKKERAAELKRKRLCSEVERKRLDLELAEVETVTRMETLKREVETRRAELALLQVEQEAQEEQQRREQRELGARRGADKEA